MGRVSGVGRLVAGARHPVQAAVVGKIRISAGTRGVPAGPRRGSPNHATDSGEPLICKSELAPILEKMAKLRQSDRPLSAQVRAWKRLAGKLVALVPPTLPPLPPFEIVDGLIDKHADRMGKGEWPWQTTTCSSRKSLRILRAGRGVAEGPASTHPRLRRQGIPRRRRARRTGRHGCGLVRRSLLA